MLILVDGKGYMKVNTQKDIPPLVSFKVIKTNFNGFVTKFPNNE